VQILSPCGVKDIVCGKLNKWASNGTELCYLTGFSVQNDSAETDEAGTVPSFCYGGKESLDSIASSWRSSGHSSASDTQNSSFWGLARVSWTIGGMVLTAGLIYIRLENCSCGPLQFLYCKCLISESGRIMYSKFHLSVILIFKKLPNHTSSSPIPHSHVEGKGVTWAFYNERGKGA
jgi:hypothetical protein